MHECSHADLVHYCGECGKGFTFKSELKKHVPVHSDVLPYACGQCPKRFCQKKSLKWHEMIHDNSTYPCEHCDKVCETPDRLYTHVRGMHGKGYNAKCGKHYSWPASRGRHQEKCDKCSAIIALEYAAKHKTPPIDDTTPSPSKKLKRESDDEDEEQSIQDLKQHINFKIENILQMKKDLWTVPNTIWCSSSSVSLRTAHSQTSVILDFWLFAFNSFLVDETVLNFCLNCKEPTIADNGNCRLRDK